jgi:hypothetical protein
LTFGGFREPQACPKWAKYMKTARNQAENEAFLHKTALKLS